MAHILAIDDDPGILALIEHALRREGHTITCMPHVPADLAAHLAEYDLILLDVMMPQTDGYELCSAIRDDTDCPILFLTAKTMEEDVDYGFSVGADDYIKKPFSIVELRARVAAHLRREQREKHHCLSIQGIRFLSEGNGSLLDIRAGYIDLQHADCRLVPQTFHHVHIIFHGLAADIYDDLRVIFFQERNISLHEHINAGIL